MPRPTVFEGWWGLVLKHRAKGRIDLLAQLCGVAPRTILRWYRRDIRIPGFQHRKTIRSVAGPKLLNHPTCPKYLRFKKVVQVGTDTNSA